MKKLLFMAIVMAISACEKVVIEEEKESGNVTLCFATTNADTRNTVNIGDYFTNLNVQLFNENGEKVFAQMKTQTSDDGNFGTLNVGLAAGTYTVVAVGHSSIRSATIKSPEVVQFTASDGEKLTDTFCYCGKVTVGENSQMFNLTMNRMTAMARFRMTDKDVPSSFSKLKIDYTGGSANFNPTTSEGCTKSSQSETRQAPASEYQVFTFPYMAKDGTLKVTLSALDANGTVIRQKTISDVQVTRNRITTYTGKLFEDGDGDIVQTGFGITLNPDWDGETLREFARMRFCMDGDFTLSMSDFTRSLSADGKEMTDVYVLDYVGDECRQAIHQQAGDDDFGKPTLTLSIGNHHLYFVAGRGSSPVLNTTAKTIRWGTVRDTFWKDLTLTVTGSGSQSVTLDRIVTKLRVTFTDAVPASCSSITVTPSTWYDGFDYTTGAPVQQQDTAQTVKVPASYVGTSGELAVNIFGVSAATEWATDISIQAKDTEANIVGQATIANAPFLRNRVTDYSGALFTFGGAYTLSLNTGWLDAVTGTW